MVIHRVPARAADNGRYHTVSGEWGIKFCYPLELCASDCGKEIWFGFVIDGETYCECCAKILGVTNLIVMECDCEPNLV